MSELLLADDGQPIQIIYIMGTGRSATTIQEVLLANNPDVVGVGEVTHFFSDGMIKKTPCACEKTVDHCTFWSSVIRKNHWQSNDAARLNTLFSAISKHSMFMLRLAGFTTKKMQQEYLEANIQLFKSISHCSGAHSIIDSSKYAGRALMLARMFPESVSIICMTRSPEGLLTAFRKTKKSIVREEQKPKSSFATLIYYMYTLLCFRLTLMYSGVQCIQLDYDSFRQQPMLNLEHIEQAFDCCGRFRVSMKRLNHGSALDVGHIVTGNRLRKRKKVLFQIKKIENYPLYRSEQVCVPLMYIWKKLLRFKNFN